MDRQKRPNIGLIVRPEAAPRHKNCFDAIEAAGGRLTPLWEGFDTADFDGLLLPGGTDVDPSCYHRKNEGSEAPDIELDRHQFSAIEAFLNAGKPVMGICRGHQVLNVFFGGTLIQDIPTHYHPSDCAQALYHSQVNDRDSAHESRAEPDGFVGRLYGERFPVNSAHHQAVERLGNGLIAVQWATDGIVEAFCHAQLPVFSVQWHPERMCLRHQRDDTVDGLVVLRDFVDHCRATD